MVTDGLHVMDLNVRYPGAQAPAVHGVSFSVRRGEVLGLLGPSGCGKSTVLAAIAGTLPLESGSVSFAGLDVTRAPIHTRSFGLVFQDGLLFPHRTVGGNVSFGLEMAHMPRPARTARVAEVLTLVGLEGLAKRRVDQLSGGERQRVALARAIAPQPQLLMLDEPFAALDTQLRGALASSVRDILIRTHTTAILVTHDPAEAAVVCDRVIKMESGSIA